MKLSNEEISALQRTLDFVQDEKRSTGCFWDWVYLSDHDLDTFPKAKERAAALLSHAQNAIIKLETQDFKL